MSYQYPFQNADEKLKFSVWEKSNIIPDFDASKWRRDKCGHAIKYFDHGDITSKYGWEIDHIFPKILGGSDDLSNLQPLHWQNNRKKGNSLTWDCD